MTEGREEQSLSAKSGDNIIVDCQYENRCQRNAQVNLMISRLGMPRIARRAAPAWPLPTRISLRSKIKTAGQSPFIAGTAVRWCWRLMLAESFGDKAVVY